MSNDIIIRPVTQGDYDQWLPLWDGYNAFYGRSGATALAAEITKVTWTRFFDSYEPVHALVADRSGELLGLTHYLFHRSTTAVAPNCYLSDLFTNQAARGKGVGRALINGVYEQAKLAGSPRCTGKRTRPTKPRCNFTTRSRSIPASSFIASCSEAADRDAKFGPLSQSARAYVPVDKYNCHCCVT